MRMIVQITFRIFHRPAARDNQTGGGAKRPQKRFGVLGSIEKIGKRLIINGDGDMIAPYIFKFDLGVRSQRPEHKQTACQHNQAHKTESRFASYRGPRAVALFYNTRKLPLTDTRVMTNFPKQCTSTIIPGLRYKDAPAAIEWLCKALGFTETSRLSQPGWHYRACTAYIRQRHDHAGLAYEFGA